MSFAEWIKMERLEEDTYVYDQHCTNCRYFYRDVNDEKVSKRPTCHNPLSEYDCRISPTMWCWAWKKGKKKYRNSYIGSADFDESFDSTVPQEVAADA